MESVFKTRVQLFIRCTGLTDVEILSKSDPYVEVYQQNGSNWKLIGRTEVIWDNLDPEFSTCIELDYFFEVETRLNFKVFDMNLDRTGKEVQGEFLGQCEYSLCQIVGNRGHWLMKRLNDNESQPVNGHISVRAVEVDNESDTLVEVEFEGVKLDYSTWCCQRLKPMFILYRMMEADGHQRVYTSEDQRGTNPHWKKMSRTVGNLAGGDMDKQLIFEFNDFSSSGKHKAIGKFSFTLKELREGDKTVFRVFSEDKLNKKYFGDVRIASIRFTPEPTFLEFLYGGCTINLVIGVDFTNSNKKPTDPKSLHYIDPVKRNPYQSALYAVGNILIEYDNDKEVPMFGYGAIVNEKVNHCFAMNFDEDNPSVSGIDGIMEAYSNSVQRVILSAPTYFAPIIAATVSMAKQANVDQFNQQYFILLIITDGQITDMRDTIDIIVEGSKYPMSIVIVGVGNEKFTSMDDLDSDDQLLENSRKEKAERDIVQFVPYNRYSDNIEGLTSEVLKEIPREVQGFFKRKGIIPNPKMEHHQDIVYK